MAVGRKELEAKVQTVDAAVQTDVVVLDIKIEQKLVASDLAFEEQTRLNKILQDNILIDGISDSIKDRFIRLPQPLTVSLVRDGLEGVLRDNPVNPNKRKVMLLMLLGMLGMLGTGIAAEVEISSSSNPEVFFSTFVGGIAASALLLCISRCIPRTRPPGAMNDFEISKIEKSLNEIAALETYLTLQTNSRYSVASHSTLIRPATPDIVRIEPFSLRSQPDDDLKTRLLQ